MQIKTAKAALLTRSREPLIVDEITVARLLGCAVTTAAGVINNDAGVKIGESVVVFGVGGVGLNVVQFAQLAGANPIVAIDLRDSKLAMAKERGATHCLNASKV